MSLTDRLYEQLTPLERLRAVISAKARGDRQERERLSDTCEMKSYKAADYEFTGRGELLHMIALGHSTDVHKLAFRTASVLSYLLLIEQDLPEGDELNDAQQAQWDRYEQVSARMQSLCAAVEGMEQGFERFVDTLGFDVDEVRKSFGVTRVHVAGYGEEPDDDVSLITVGELEPAVIGAKAKERYELYGKAWQTDFRDLSDIAAPRSARKAALPTPFVPPPVVSYEPAREPDPPAAMPQTVEPERDTPKPRREASAPIERKPKFDKLEEYRGEPRVHLWEPSQT